MRKKQTNSGALALVLALLLTLVLVSPALAFESRAGENIEIPAGEVIEDDLYLTGDQIRVGGTIRGDLIAFGSDIFISGSVEGDVIAAGAQVILSGEVGDDLRAAGAVIEIQDTASVGGDVVAAGFSLTTAPGSQIEGDVVFGGYQSDLDGEIGGSALVGSNSLRLRGTINGSLSASVSSPEERMPFSPFGFMPNMPDVDLIPGGFTLGEQAEVLGNLEIEADNVETLDIPEERIQGSIERTEALQQDPTDQPATVQQPPNPVLSWFFTLLRSLIALVVIGLLLVWLAPRFLQGLANTLRQKPWSSLGWGLLTFLLLPLLAVVLIMVITLLVFFLYALTLGNLGGALIWLGITVVLTLLVSFGLAAAFLAKLVVGYLLGFLLLERINAAWVEKPVWPLLAGLLLLALLLSIPILGWLINLVTTLFGLGALTAWLYARLRGESPAG